MKTLPIILAIILPLLPTIFGFNIVARDITPSDPIVIAGLDDEIEFNVEIANNGNSSEHLRIYNILGFEMTPSESFVVLPGKTQQIDLTVIPRTDISTRGFYTISSHITNDRGDSKEIQLVFKIRDLENLFQIGTVGIDRDENSIEIFIENKENITLKDLEITFSSDFFESTHTTDLGKRGRETFSLELNQEDFKKLQAGFYTFFADVSYKDKQGRVEGIINFEADSKLTTLEDSYGIIIVTDIITKSNEGNTLEEAQIELTRNMISRLFTTFNHEPDLVQREGTKITYTWEIALQPGQSFEVKAKTNWSFPLIIIVLIIVIVYLVKRLTRQDVRIKKKVSFLKAKGGEFALKVSLTIDSRKYIENVSIIDKLPPLVKVYPRFGPYEPNKVDEAHRKITWNFEKLEENEKRVLTYIIYSKLGVVGRIALPNASAFYDKEGKMHESTSNKTYFVSEAVKE